MQMATFSGRREFRDTVGSVPSGERNAEPDGTPSTEGRSRRRDPTDLRRRGVACATSRRERRHKGRHTPRAYVTRRRARTPRGRERDSPTPDVRFPIRADRDGRRPRVDGHPRNLAGADTYLARNRRQPPPPPPFP